MDPDTAGPASPAAAAVPEARRVTLDIQGMTCASCVRRVERKLGKIDGVEATVNLPLEQATVTAPADVEDERLLETVAAAGYSATVRADPATHRAPQDPASAETRAADGDGAPAHTGHDDAASPESHMDHGPARSVLVPRLILAAALTVPLVVISMVPSAQFPHWGWAAFALATPVVLWSGWPFHAAAARTARHGSSTMDTLVSIGVLAAWGYSTVELLLDPAMTAHVGGGMADMAHHSLYFESAAVITTFLLLGRWLEARAKSRAGQALRALLDLGAARATLVDLDATGRPVGEERLVPAESLRPGDVMLVRPGEKVPTDAVVLEGRSAVDTSLLTGESVPVEVGAGAELTGATVNLTGRLLARATRVGSETTLAQMGRLVAEAQTGKARVARVADRVSAVFVPIVLAIATLTFLAWMGVSDGDVASALRAAVAVLVIACPCALGLATPVGLLAGTGRASQLGILVRGPEVLEDSRTVDTIVLDKTGTVTRGEMRLTEAARAPGSPVAADDALLALAAAVEDGSEHPIARAVVAAARERGLALPEAVDFVSEAGGGVHALVADGHGGRLRVAVGRGSFIGSLLGPEAIGADAAAAFEASEAAGRTAVWVAVDGRLAGHLAVEDTVRETSADAIGRLRRMGLRPLLVTGDNAAVARAVAAQVGIAAEDVVAGVRPEDKVAVVARLQAEGATVAMVGDGVNDAPALARADVGIAMGTGTDVARQAAQITVMGSDLTQVVQALELSQRTLGIIRMNLFWAFAYNTLGIPVAALGLLNPMIAGGAMAASSVLVVLNSLRLTRYGR